ncbi:hypothetical protein AXF42_Ash005815 [Apostasia shenzhenica]|uniref:Uncharacterized protein n=1 Tax=Apostasia shenzhenica TaxID=1088818 RepID=A0A2I0BCF8_9ASPA|nr:hypothetical protein AXF42_Ash005815 [Apostasia shenzhenica]
MMKKRMRVPMDSAPLTSFLVGEEARARFKHQCLLQDYHELLKETEQKQEKLQKATQRKLKLLAEVKKRNHNSKQVSLQTTPALLDLNQNGEEMEAFQVQWEPLEVEKLKRFSIEREAMGSDLQLSICRDVGGGSDGVRERISWQDQLALRV